MNVAARYAKSIFELAQDSNSLEAISNDMHLIQSVIKSNADLQNVLLSPVYPKSQKMDALNAIFTQIHAHSKSLMSIMISKKRESLLADVATEFLSFKYKSEGITIANVISVNELTENELDSIKAYIKNQTQSKSIEISTSVDSSLIGGFKIIFDGKQYDSSVSTQLNNIKKELKLV